MIKLKLQKCIFGISVKGTPYHYWREVKNINKVGLFWVQEVQIIKGDEFITSSVVLYNKEEYELFDEIIDIIDGEMATRKRQWKLEQVLGLSN